MGDMAYDQAYVDRQTYSHTEIYKSTSCTKKPEENDAELHIMIMGLEQAELSELW